MSIEENYIEKINKGLAEYNMSFSDISAGNFKYCGGNQNNHLNYFKLMFPNMNLPPQKDYCICGHKIIENCYITDGITFVTMGNCCIKKFVPKNTRTCDICDAKHTNRIVNRCNNCRVNHCDGCGIKHILYKNKLCDECMFKQPIKQKPKIFRHKCDICAEPHNNRKDNLCNDCRKCACYKCYRAKKYKYLNYCLDCSIKSGVISLCSICTEPHENKFDKCDTCKIGYCNSCGVKKTNLTYSNCYPCYQKILNSKTGECMNCGDKCNPKYKLCYSCKFG